MQLKATFVITHVLNYTVIEKHTYTTYCDFYTCGLQTSPQWLSTFAKKNRLDAPELIHMAGAYNYCDFYTCGLQTSPQWLSTFAKKNRLDAPELIHMAGAYNMVQYYMTC